MRDFGYVKRFEKLGFGLFVHFGLYSITGKGEWICSYLSERERENYFALPAKFRVKANWAKELARAAKNAGCRYITLTARHHDGFSLYDTCGLNDFDAPHSAAGRDLVREFTKACREQGVVPFFYHTLLDWHHPDYNKNFPAYLDYLIESVQLLCENYGEIGGIWFDGMWDKPNENWQEDRLYSAIRARQPEAMIINNTGLSALGKVGHFELDSVTFERGNPRFVDRSDRPRAGEMCQVLNDHWGYAKGDCNYKSVKELIENLVDCRYCNCNFLLNTGPKGNGSLNGTDAALLSEIGKWVRANKGFFYEAKSSDLQCEGGFALTDGKYDYIVVKDVQMEADPNVTILEKRREIVLPETVKIKSACWLDSGEKIAIENNRFAVKPFPYGTSLSVRVAKLEREK